MSWNKGHSTDQGRQHRWLDEWRHAAATRDLSNGPWCPEFQACAPSTQRVAAELWRRWHDAVPGPKHRMPFFPDVDAISVEGETLVWAVCFHLFDVDPDESAVGHVVRAVQELCGARLVEQRHQGRWEIHFGVAFSREELAAHDTERALLRERYRTQTRER